MAKCFNVGKMRHRITIQQPSDTPDGIGGNTRTWTTFATVWASIEPLNAFQIFKAQHLEHRVTHKVMIRYLAGLTSDMRISYDSRIFGIEGIKDIDETKNYFELMVEENAPS